MLKEIVMVKKLKVSKERKRAIVIWSLILTLIFDFILIGISFQFTGKEVPSSHPIHESTEPYYFIMKTYYTGPNIFFPYANLDFAVANQYSDKISGFHFFLSFDNSSWVEIPLTKPLNVTPDFPPEPNFILTNVGIIALNGFSNVLYAKCIFPPQEFDNATDARILNAFQAFVYVEPIWTPQSVATFILVSVALMSFIIQILDFWTKETTEKKEERKDAEKTSISRAQN
jgi:hypothetical protein